MRKKQKKYMKSKFQRGQTTQFLLSRVFGSLNYDTISEEEREDREQEEK